MSSDLEILFWTALALIPPPLAFYSLIGKLSEDTQTLLLSGDVPLATLPMMLTYGCWWCLLATFGTHHKQQCY